LKGYEIARQAEIHPSTLSKILNAIEDVTPGDPRVLRIAKVLGLKPADCFGKSGEMQNSTLRQERKVRQRKKKVIFSRRCGKNWGEW
jgi:plasmid maintenance system antidote protein VapI